MKMAKNIRQVVSPMAKMREDVEDVRERYRLYLLTPPKKRHHRLNMEEVVEKSKG